MPILTVSPCQSGVIPRQIRVLSDDNYDTITAENYFLGTSEFGLTIVPGDFICCSYADNGFGIFKTVFSDGNLNVEPYSNASGSIVSVVGNIPEFMDTTGKTQDSGIAAATLATIQKPTVTGNFVKASNTSGDLQDSGISPESLLQMFPYSYSGGSSSTTFILTNIIPGMSKMMISPVSTANSVSILGCNITALNTFTVTWSGNPGATSFLVLVKF